MMLLIRITLRTRKRFDLRTDDRSWTMNFTKMSQRELSGSFISGDCIREWLHHSLDRTYNDIHID